MESQNYLLLFDTHESVYDELHFIGYLSKYSDEPLSQISQILNFVVAYIQYIYTF
jgi:hypothetical protein